MGHPLSRDRDLQAEAEKRKYEKRMARQLREDVRAVLSNIEGRRLVFTFIQVMDIDGTPFNTNAMAQSHGIGMQDAGRWWLNIIREHCPEREAQMRAEANKALKQAPDHEDESNDD